VSNPDQFKTVQADRATNNGFGLMYKKFRIWILAFAALLSVAVTAGINCISFDSTLEARMQILTFLVAVMAGCAIWGTFLVLDILAREKRR
jgi:hypothetical protein